jgi:RND family efflux transporter MFP subunit
MRRAYWALLAIGMMVDIATTGCASAGATDTAPGPTQAVPSVRAVQSAGVVTASARVEPSQTSDMAFLIAAPVREVDVKQGEQVKGGQSLIVLDTPDLQYHVAAARAELESAQLNARLQSSTRKYRAWTGRKWVWISSLPEVQAQADARLQRAQAALDVAQANLSQGTLVAPFDGTVVAVNVVPGEMVVPEKTVVIIGDLGHLQVATTDLSERDIAKVQVGQTATTRLKAFAQDLTGKVAAIAPMSTQHNGDTVYKVTIQFVQQPENLLWGMTGDVEIQITQ